MDQQLALVGIDASIRSTGLSIIYPDKTVKYALCLGIENAATCELVEWIEAWSGYFAFAIECPDWSGHGTREVRASSLAWKRLVEDRIPRVRRSVFVVSPRVWQSQLLGRCKGMTKQMAVLRAEGLLGHKPESFDVADAVCLAEWAGYCYSAEKAEKAMRKAGMKANKGKPKWYREHRGRGRGR